MTYRFRDFVIRDFMMGGLIRYIEEHIEPGDFLMAVLENNLSEACGRADDDNIENLPAFCAFLYNEAPAACHGSPEKVSAWLAMRE